MPPSGGLLPSSKDPTIRLNDGRLIPSLAFGLYKVPKGDEGVRIISDAIRAGYRHFDCASVYKNETELGQAIRLSGLPREHFFISSKVWNDAQQEGVEAVRSSIRTSLSSLGTEYIDLMYVHWPVPGHFVDTYRVLQEFHTNKSVIRNIGISNFGIAEYEKLMTSDGVTVPPAVNQIEISPLMYRPKTIQYFQDQGVTMVASKALHRACGIDVGAIPTIAKRHHVTPAQILLRWGIQHGLVVVAKTSRIERMSENRSLLDFTLTDEEMNELNSMTSEEHIRAREELELQRKNDV